MAAIQEVLTDRQSASKPEASAKFNFSRLTLQALTASRSAGNALGSAQAHSRAQMSYHVSMTLQRDVRRPVPRRTRTFRPNYVSFAGTYQCNLTCAHCCVPIEWTDRLDIAVAVRFLEGAHRHGIALLGFTGGEPFLYPEFVIALTRRAAELGFQFDKIVTNGVWFKDEPPFPVPRPASRTRGFHPARSGLAKASMGSTADPRLPTWPILARRYEAMLLRRARRSSRRAYAKPRSACRAGTSTLFIG